VLAAAAVLVLSPEAALTDWQVGLAAVDQWLLVQGARGTHRLRRPVREMQEVLGGNPLSMAVAVVVVLGGRDKWPVQQLRARAALEPQTVLRVGL
jgi:hypothetical protein